MTTLTPDKQAWADAHNGAVVEQALRGQVTSYDVLDDGRVAFHVTGGSIVDDAGTPTFHADGTEGTFIATPPLSADEIAAQLVAQDEAAAAEQAANEQQAASEAASRQAEIDAAVERRLQELGLAPA